MLNYLGIPFPCTANTICHILHAFPAKKMWHSMCKARSLNGGVGRDGAARSPTRTVLHVCLTRRWRLTLLLVVAQPKHVGDSEDTCNFRCHFSAPYSYREVPGSGPCGPTCGQCGATLETSWVCCIHSSYERKQAPAKKAKVIYLQAVP
jgi:hypothetical protein